MQNKKQQITLIEGCNFIDHPLGGQLTFVKNILKSTNEDIVLVGITTDVHRVGEWTSITLNGKQYRFFPYMRIKRDHKKPFIPYRIQSAIKIHRFKKEIRREISEIVITQAPEILLSINNWSIPNLIYYFAGTENPLSLSRYFLGRIFQNLYDSFFIPSLIHCKTILAAADIPSIEKIESKFTKGVPRIIQFPTRIDDSIFYRRPKDLSKKILNLSSNETIIITSGRLGWFKGWKFMIDSFLTANIPNSILYFAGDGEDKEKIHDYILKLGMQNRIHLLGSLSPQLLSDYLNAADLFIMGSYKEGWSTALLEALACGCPSVTTNFSSSKEIIIDNVNGYVTVNRSEVEFAQNMKKCLEINFSNEAYQNIISKYTIKTLYIDLLKIINNEHFS